MKYSAWEIENGKERIIKKIKRFNELMGNNFKLHEHVGFFTSFVFDNN